MQGVNIAKLFLVKRRNWEYCDLLLGVILMHFPISEESRKCKDFNLKKRHFSAAGMSDELGAEILAVWP